jgi:uncharacterized protein YndB with AHSA1/START domain
LPELALFRSRIAAAVLACGFAVHAGAEVKESAADGFFIAFSAPVAAPAAKAYADVTQIQRWWSSEHTWSGKASNLSLKPEAGGCFCERWKDGSVEHGRVIMAMPGKLLRIETALGPLQERALEGILNFWIKTEDSATTLTVEYRVNGASASGLDQLAPSVDEVLGTQVDRLRRYIATGSPEPSAQEKAAAAAAATAAKDAADEADIAARVDELKSQMESGMPAPVKAGKPGVTKPKTKPPETPPQHP